ncbi:hypothetical protein GYMLUDRAFT_63169 [Collybiopsis luxurians FD-317 M1]|uniref:Uncharacterized protein n=1 Tax=Collybiopsis luxurians FD-317 M1 TaxID=944289 RepID=A0A0D0BHU8_9AGAR|nr:hypothetical protein GYMLUDRAFT_63169 [Collybiopsis luxurians FD-317 M1]
MKKWKPQALIEHITKKGMDPKNTILYGDHWWFYGAYQVLLPLHYLLKSDLNPANAHGENSLGLRLVRVEVSDIPSRIGQYEESGLPVCEWDLLKTEDWPEDVKMSTKEGREAILKKGWMREDHCDAIDVLKFCQRSDEVIEFKHTKQLHGMGIEMDCF